MASSALLTAPRLFDAAGLVLDGVFLAEADGREEPSFGEVVKGGKLFGEQDGIAKGQGEDARAELEGVGVGGDHGQGYDGFEGEATTHHPVAEPDGVVAPLFAYGYEVTDEVVALGSRWEGAWSESDSDL